MRLLYLHECITQDKTHTNEATFHIVAECGVSAIELTHTMPHPQLVSRNHYIAGYSDFSLIR
ncbi:MAG: hypothetical protein OXC63_10610, partial [Aestuariivita sp.]|nr:hypothetical protein [Aestuariivita sp.]MCY4347462.1 hypothetical protein [Aestuariivita sp.]